MVARGGINCPMSSLVDSAEDPPTLSVHPAASSTIVFIVPLLVLRAPEKRHLTTDFFSLIGEHIDYALFGVFPAAIERDILLACGPSDPHGLPHGAVSAENLDHRFPPRSFSPVRNFSVGREVEDVRVGDIGEWHLDIDKKELRWESYVKAGYYVGALMAHPIISVSYRGA